MRSAMHLNVPVPNEDSNVMYMRLFKWGLMGLFAPELVVFAAWRQWNSAKTLEMELQKLWEDEPDKVLSSILSSTGLTGYKEAEKQVDDGPWILR